MAPTPGRAGALAALDIAAGVLSVAVSFWIATLYLNGQPWFDELWTLSLVRPGTTPLDLLDRLRNDAHPYLYFGLIGLAQQLGAEGIGGFRAVNLLAFLLLGLPLYAAVRSGDLPWRTALLILVLALGSRLCARYFSELRPYFLAYGAALGLSVVWATLARRALLRTPLRAHQLALWGLTLAALCNLQYFGAIMGGILTALMLGLFLRRGLIRPAIALVPVSGLAVAPAAALAVIQMQGTISGDMGWITTGPLDGFWVVARVAGHAGLGNLGAVFGAGLAVLLAARAGRGWTDLAPALGLLLAAGLFLGLVAAVNVVKPWIVDRYLVAGAAAVTVGLAMLATDPATWRTAPRLARGFFLIACLCGPLMVLLLHAGGGLARDGWRPSALALKAAVQACPASPVYSATTYTAPPVGSAYAALVLEARRYAHAYYGRQLEIPAQEAIRGVPIGPRSGCPAIVWIEHVFDPAYVAPFLATLTLPPGAPVKVRYVGSGALVMVGEPRKGR